MSEETTTIVQKSAERAAQADAEVDSILNWMNGTLEEGSTKHARLGRLLVEVSENELYRVLGFHSFEGWLRERIKKYNHLSRTQAYAYMFTARHLLPHVDEKQFEEIGINKSKVIASAIKLTGVAPKPELIEAATNPKVTESQLRQMVVEAYNIPDDPKPERRWYDLGALGAVYAEDEEWAEIRRAVEVAHMTDPVMKAEASDSAKLLDALLKMSRDYLSGHEAEVNGEQE